MMSHRVPQAAGRRQARHSRGLFLSSEANGQTIFGAAVLFDKYYRLHTSAASSFKKKKIPQPTSDRPK
jgi:hypothetical protein